MSAMRAIAPIRTRPTSRPTASSVVELDTLLAKRLEQLSPDCYDGETIGHIGQAAHNRSLGAYSAITDVRSAIAAWLSEEMEEQAQVAAEESAEQRYRDLDPVDDALTIRRLAGDR